MPSPADIKITVFGKTDVGLVREHNEDNFLIADVTRRRRARRNRASRSEIPLGGKGALFLVCDGMGGAAAGEVASQMAVESIYVGAGRVRAAAARRASRACCAAPSRTPTSASSPSRATTRASAAWAPPAPPSALVDGTLVLAQIGDSRCYVLRDGGWRR